MRRMYSDGQVVKVVNKAIEEGEIQAGGLTPEQKEKIDNALQLPESAPAAQQLVGINTSGEQNALGLGEGLIVDNGELKATNDKILTVDFAGSTYLDITNTDIQTKLANKYYDKIIVKHYQSTSTTYIITASLTSALLMSSSGQPEVSSLEYFIDNFTPIGQIPFSLSGSTPGNCSVADLGDIIFTGFGPSGNTKWKLLYTSANHRLSVDIGFNYGGGWFRSSEVGNVELTTAGGVIPGNSKIIGKDAGSMYLKPKGYANTYVYFCKEGNDKVILRPVQYQQTADLGWNPIVVLKGEHYNTATGVKDYEYVAILHCHQTPSSSSYTLTRTAVNQ